MEVSGKIHAPGKKSQYPLNRRLGGPKSQSGRGGKEKQSLLCLCWKSNPDHAVHSLVTIVTESEHKKELRRLKNCICELSFDNTISSGKFM
jgi:hypothetical protein